MGVNIYVLRGDGERCPKWSHLSHAGDRELASGMGSLPQNNYGNETLRPSDFRAWREARCAETSRQCNPGRWDQMLDLLEVDPGLVLRVVM